jgi:hypothetical protein
MKEEGLDFTQRQNLRELFLFLGANIDPIHGTLADSDNHLLFNAPVVDHVDRVLEFLEKVNFLALSLCGSQDLPAIAAVKVGCKTT